MQTVLLICTPLLCRDQIVSSWNVSFVEYFLLLEMLISGGRVQSLMPEP